MNCIRVPKDTDDECASEEENTLARLLKLLCKLAEVSNIESRAIVVRLSVEAFVSAVSECGFDLEAQDLFLLLRVLGL